jgi:hypothetical protein
VLKSWGQTLPLPGIVDLTGDDVDRVGAAADAGGLTLAAARGLSERPVGALQFLSLDSYSALNTDRKQAPNQRKLDGLNPHHRLGGRIHDINPMEGRHPALLGCAVLMIEPLSPPPDEPTYRESGQAANC